MDIMDEELANEDFIEDSVSDTPGGMFDEVVETARRTMVLFFVVDTSTSMEGTKIGEVNTAIEEVLPEIQDISDSNADARIKIATLAFSTSARWITDKPEPVEIFKWSDLEAYGVTDLGEACEQLNEKLSRKAFMNDVGGSYAPAIFLLSDGVPTDDYRHSLKHSLKKLKENRWFKAAIKVAIAIAIGKDADRDVLAEFTGNTESVITVHKPEEPRKWIRFVSVTASKIGSKSSNASSNDGTDDDGSKQTEFTTAIEDEKKCTTDIPDGFGSGNIGGGDSGTGGDDSGWNITDSDSGWDSYGGDDIDEW